MDKYFKITSLFFITLLLISCAGKTPVSPDSSAGNGEILMQQKEFIAAAEEFQRQAKATAGTEKNIFLLRAVTAYIKAELKPKAVQLFEQIQINEHDIKQSAIARLTQAHLALAERDADTVLHYLVSPLPADSSTIYISEYHALRAAAFSMQSDRLATAKEYILHENYLSDEDDIAENQRNIWMALAMLSERALQQMQPAKAPDVLSGWMELVRLSKVYQLNPVMLRSAIENWQRDYSDHPVQLTLLDNLRNRKQEDVVVPENIALLLPLSGRFAKPAQAIRDGFFAAYYAQKIQKNMTVRVYDTAGSPEIIERVYDKAVSNGAKFIIGPLNKTSIEQLANTQQLPVPTLALNYIQESSSLPSELYQFGLSPEEEAKQVAERTWLDGHVNAVVLTPEGPWGDRIHQAFRQRWEEIGGKVVEQQSYTVAKNNFSDPIKKMLDIDESRARYRKLSRLLNKKLKYSPRRRKDVDFIFLAAHPRQARQIRPQLKFFHAASVPVYSTSHIFTGNLNPERDRDMDGMRFGDMPWVLSETTIHRGLRNDIESQISKEGTKHQRLYALGVDAFNIIAALNTLKRYPYERYQGETGSLSLDGKQQIKRQLSWVYFRSGRPVMLEQEAQQ